MWNDLSLPWRAALDEAWQAFCEGCIPIGAAVADGENHVIARGRSQNECNEPNANPLQDHKLAHAQMNVLLQVKGNRKQLKSSALFCTCEPCPMCMGALYMSGIRDIFFAMKDPYSGSAELLRKTDYLSIKPVRSFGPFSEELEAVLMAINTAYILGSKEFEYSEMLQVWESYLSQAVAFGKKLREEKVLNNYVNEQEKAEVVFESLLEHYKEFTA